ncbi:MAG: hypothetical protein ABWZ63_04650 [Thermoleophilaceae bacterium]
MAVPFDGSGGEPPACGDWVEELINSGEPLQDVVIVALILPTLAFFLLHSKIGFLRWRLQPELWRRDVERLGSARGQ